MPEHKDASALAAFIEAAYQVLGTCLDEMPTEQVESISAAIDEGARVAIASTLSGPPMVIGYLTRPGEQAVEVFRLLAQPGLDQPTAH